MSKTMVSEFQTEVTLSVVKRGSNSRPFLKIPRPTSVNDVTHFEQVRYSSGVKYIAIKL